MCGAAVLTVVVLVVLPLLSLLWGSLWTGHGVGAANFARVLSQRLYFDSLFNSLALGAWTALLSIIIGVPLAWAVVRTNLPRRDREADRDAWHIGRRGFKSRPRSSPSTSLARARA